MATITLEALQDYTRGLDTRLSDVKKYPDSWVDGTITTAFELCATERQPFFKQEVLDLTPYIDDGTAKFEVDMSEHIAGWREIYVTAKGIRTDHTGITFQLKEDNIVVVELDIDSLISSRSYEIVFDYYYVPQTNFTETFMTRDVQHMLKHAIGMIAYEKLRDFEKEQLMSQRFEESKRTVTNSLDIYANEVTKPNWGML